jgi:hypothetical protein
MNSNEYYRLRKEFSKEDSVEPVEYNLVDTIPNITQPFWSYKIRGQTVSSYSTGSGASLVVFDNIEGEHAYWAKGGVDIFLSLDLSDTDTEPIIDITDHEERPSTD